MASNKPSGGYYYDLGSEPDAPFDSIEQNYRALKGVGERMDNPVGREQLSRVGCSCCQTFIASTNARNRSKKRGVSSLNLLVALPTIIPDPEVPPPYLLFVDQTLLSPLRFRNELHFLSPNHRQHADLMLLLLLPLKNNPLALSVPPHVN